jgi:aminoacylase
VDEWTKEDGLSYEFVYRTPGHYTTSTDRNDNKFWAAFEDACQKAGVELEKEIFPAATDGRYVRGANVPVFGFSPMPRTPILLHDHQPDLDARDFAIGPRL